MIGYPILVFLFGLTGLLSAHVLPEDEQQLKQILYASTGAAHVEPPELLRVLESLQAIYSSKTDPESVKELEQIKKFVEISRSDESKCLPSFVEDLNNLMREHKRSHINLVDYLEHYRKQQMILCERVKLEPEIARAQYYLEKVDVDYLRLLKEYIVKAQGTPIKEPYFDIKTTALFDGVRTFMKSKRAILSRSYNDYNIWVLSACKRLKDSGLSGSDGKKLFEKNAANLKQENLEWLTYDRICHELQSNKSSIKDEVFGG